MVPDTAKFYIGTNPLSILKMVLKIKSSKIHNRRFIFSRGGLIFNSELRINLFVTEDTLLKHSHSD